MSAEHHDLVLAITSHLPHLIAYTIVGTADELGERDTLGGAQILGRRLSRLHPHRRLRSHHVARHVPANHDAVLEMLGRFNEDISLLTRAIRCGDGDALFDLFTRTRAIRRGIVETGQDAAGARLRPPAIRACRRAAAAALRGG